ncbi:MAG: hypothetical protein ACYCZV_16095, partial [Acidimicrobiales bacterium]
MPRRFAYKAPPPTLAPVVGLPTTGVVVVRGRSPGGVISQARLDPHSYSTPVLARELALAWAGRFANETEASLASVFDHKGAIVDLLDYCGRVSAPGSLSCRNLTAALLDDWQDDLARRYPSAHSGAAGDKAGKVFAHLRHLRAMDPKAVGREALERACKPTSYPSGPHSQPLPEFCASDLRRLIPAAVTDVWETERRINTGRDMVANAEDPRRSGRWTFPNVVWLAAQGELTVAELRANLTPRWRDWDDALRQAAPKVAGHNTGGRVGELARYAYRHVFPHPLDLVGHF